MAENSSGSSLEFRPLPAPAARRWGWEHTALAVLLLTGATLAGVRPDALPGLARAWSVARLVEQAEAGNARQAAQAWAEVARLGPRTQRFQTQVLLQRLRASRRAGDAQGLAALEDELARSEAARQGDPHLALALGMVQAHRGEFERARDTLAAGLRRTAKGDPIALGLRESLALVYDRLGQRREAEQLYLGLLDAQPGNPTAFNNLAYHYAEAGTNLERAERLVQHALQTARRQAALTLSTRSPAYLATLATYLDTLGWIHYRQGKLDSAQQQLERAVRLTDEAPSAEILYHLAQVYYDRGSDLQAQQLVARALELDPTLEPAWRLNEHLKGRPSGPDQVS